MVGLDVLAVGLDLQTESLGSKSAVRHAIFYRESLRKCDGIPDIKVQHGVFVLISVNELGTQSRV